MTWPHAKLKFVARFALPRHLVFVYCRRTGIFTRSLRTTVDLFTAFLRACAYTNR